MIYDYYVRVYDMTGKEVDDKVLVKISEKYGFDSLEFDIIFSVLYMTMIAEENKRYIRLRKRIKRLGVFLLL